MRSFFECFEDFNVNDDRVNNEENLDIFLLDEMIDDIMDVVTYSLIHYYDIVSEESDDEETVDDDFQ